MHPFFFSIRCVTERAREFWDPSSIRSLFTCYAATIPRSSSSKLLTALCSNMFQSTANFSAFPIQKQCPVFVNNKKCCSSGSTEISIAARPKKKTLHVFASVCQIPFNNSIGRKEGLARKSLNVFDDKRFDDNSCGTKHASMEYASSFFRRITRDSCFLRIQWISYNGVKDAILDLPAFVRRPDSLLGVDLHRPYADLLANIRRQPRENLRRRIYVGRRWRTSQITTDNTNFHVNEDDLAENRSQQIWTRQRARIY